MGGGGEKPLSCELLLCSLCLPFCRRSQGTSGMIDALTLFYSFGLNSSHPPSLPSPLSSPSCHPHLLASQFLMHLLSFHYSSCISPEPLEAISAVFLISFSLLHLLLSNSDELIRGAPVPPCHSSDHYSTILPSQFNSVTPLIPLSSFPQHTMRHPPPFLPLFSTPLLPSHP